MCSSLWRQGFAYVFEPCFCRGFFYVKVTIAPGEGMRFAGLACPSPRKVSLYSCIHAEKPGVAFHERWFFLSSRDKLLTKTGKLG